MRYHIDTIPVWDVYKQGGECPLCTLEETCESSYLDYFMGASVMEPAVRVEVNKKGFCAPHLRTMLGMQNRLGLSLMLHSHMLSLLDSMEPRAPKKSGLFAKKAAKSSGEADAPCILCERTEETMNRYLYTVLHLWKTDSEFKKLFEQANGHCMPHHRRLCEMAEEEFREERATAFVEMLSALQEENMRRIASEVEWFTLKFDYRNTEKPWGSAKDAPERAILKLRGRRR